MKRMLTSCAHILKLAVLMLIGAAAFRASAFAADGSIRYALTDLRVLYLYDSQDQIDWPTLFYLNDHHGARIDLVRFREAGAFYRTTETLDEQHIYRHDVYLPGDKSVDVDSAFAALFHDRRPDIVLVGPVRPSGPGDLARAYLTAMEPDRAALFNIVRVYRESEPGPGESTDNAVVVETGGLYGRYKDRMALAIPRLFDGLQPNIYQPRPLTRYRLVVARDARPVTITDFADGLPSLRLEQAIDSLLSDGRVRGAFIQRAHDFQSYFGSAVLMTGRPRVESIIRGYKELLQLQYQARSQDALRSTPGLMAYLERLVSRAQAATLDEMGLQWNGRIALRESPHGPKLKFTAEVAVYGPREVELSYIRFYPYWDSTVVTLDSTSRRIQPHGRYEREYLVNIDQSRLETNQPESLTFAAEIVYSQIPLKVQSAIPVWQAPQLSVSFQPGFHFVPPAARLNIDKLVSSMNWKVRIDKPRSYSGPVRLVLETPEGVFAGAYRQEVELEPDYVSDVIRIPFSVSNLFPMGVHSQTVSLLVNERVVSADTGLIRVASCDIADTVTVAFLPDSLGILEDVLRMSGANYQPLTNRALWTADLNAYSVIVIGSGAFREYPALTKIKARLEEYVRFGGSLVILGQPYDWPEDVLPMSLTPTREVVDTADIITRLPHANVLSRPYRIEIPYLLAPLELRQAVSSAVVSPSERVFITHSGATLLSVSRLGGGQVIYCGLPLLEMIGGLNLEAIHLFANLLNY